MSGIHNYKFEHTRYPDVVDTLNELAELEERRPHDAARRLIVNFGRQRINELRRLKQQGSRPAAC